MSILSKTVEIGTLCIFSNKYIPTFYSLKISDVIFCNTLKLKKNLFLQREKKSEMSIKLETKK